MRFLLLILVVLSSSLAFAGDPPIPITVNYNNPYAGVYTTDFATFDFKVKINGPPGSYGVWNGGSMTGFVKTEIMGVTQTFSLRANLDVNKNSGWLTSDGQVTTLANVTRCTGPDTLDVGWVQTGPGAIIQRDKMVGAYPAELPLGVNLGNYHFLVIIGASENPITTSIRVEGYNKDSKIHTMRVVVQGVDSGTKILQPGENGHTSSVNAQTHPGDAWGVYIDGEVVAAGRVPLTGVEGGARYEPPELKYEWYTTTPPSAPDPSVSPPTPATSVQTNTGGTTTVKAGSPPTPASPPSTGYPTGVPAGAGAPSSASSVVNNGNTTIAGGSGGATVQDMYHAMYRALGDSGASGIVPDLASGKGSAGGEDLAEEGTLTRGHLDDMQGMLEGGRSEAEAIRGKQVLKAGAFKTAMEPLRDFTAGTVSTFSFGTIPIGSKMYNVKMDFGWAASTLAMIRQVMLWIITILFAFKVMNQFVKNI